MATFAVATLLPAALIAAGLLWGGIWAVAALLSMTALAMGLDALVARVPESAPGVEFPAAHGLSLALAVLHFALLALVVLSLGRGWTGPWAAWAAGIAAGMWFGQVSNSNAHELIHRTGRGSFRLGTAVYVSLLFGHHASAHRLVHHVHVGLPEDPNTARAGEGFWRFAPRAWIGSFRAGLQAETARRRRHRRGLHPFAFYLGGAALALAIAAALGGTRGLAALAGLAVYAQIQLLLSDYVQHYGLTRPRDAAGRALPVSAALSWNAPHWFTGHMMLNAPRHSDHHQNPGRPYPALRLAPGPATPMLPASLPVMAALATLPPLWHRAMRRPLKRLARDLDRQAAALAAGAAAASAGHGTIGSQNLP